TSNTTKQGIVTRCKQQVIAMKESGVALGVLASVGAGEAVAQGLPTTAAPTRGADDGNFIQLLQNYAFDIFIFLGLAVATVTFFVVAKNCIGIYSEVQDGKATWGQFGMHGGVGVMLLVFVVFLLTEAADIL
ncbi:MAG: TIGR03745 family integrating conjugative element membrane protein, partial [Pseudomonadota bacterium]